MKFEVINLEEGHPAADEAMNNLKSSLKCFKERKTECAVIIHGYGSSGRGGVIRESVRKYLKSKLKKGELKAVIQGEDFTIFDSKSRELKNRYPSLKEYIDNGNPGVTIIEI